jgi:hypothetical protein
MAKITKIRGIFLGLLFLTFSAGGGAFILLFHTSSAEGGFSSQITVLQQNQFGQLVPAVMPIPAGSTFYIQATNVKNKDNIYIVIKANPGTCGGIFGGLAYSFQSVSQAHCTGAGGNMTCIWTFTNGGSPALTPGGWCIYLVESGTSPPVGGTTFGGAEITVK